MSDPCTHPVQLAGLCAVCGIDITSTVNNSLHISHSTANLTVTYDEAKRISTRSKHSLLKSSKLSLIVDLDQTVIHATVDPTVQSWLDDPSLVYPGALDDIHKFKLDDFTPLNQSCSYFVKFRPGLIDFLHELNHLYELHVYTMGTKSYAAAVCQLIDPTGSLFSERILTRDDSGSFTSKSLLRLFPTDTSMCVIIDDRADVWSDSPNLVKCNPFEFFVGIGDINAGEEEVHFDEEVGEKGGEDSDHRDHHNLSLSQQANQRPLAQRQREHRQLLSRTPDAELPRLLRILRQIHSTYYTYRNAGDDPDVAEIIPHMQRLVLRGVHLLFSAVVPLGAHIEHSPLYHLAVRYGAQVHTTYSSAITHVVAAKKGTAKVDEARREDVAHVVTPQWLIDSCNLWECRKEDSYYLDSHSRPKWPKQVQSFNDKPTTDHVDWDTADQELEDFLNEDSAEEEKGEKVKENTKKRSRKSSTPPSIDEQDLHTRTNNQSNSDTPKRHRTDNTSDDLDSLDKDTPSDNHSDSFDDFDFANQLDGVI
ncbi:hypothetical protein E3P98_01697 [Wallemia ichthyophaga]|nr:hypothetical protein E3P98_01697 [Wallemia ichthyophaga]